MWLELIIGSSHRMVWRMVLILDTNFSKAPTIQCDLVYFSAWTLNVGSGSFWGYRVEQLTGLVFRVSWFEVPEMLGTKRSIDSIDPKFASQLSRAFLRFCSSIDCLGLVIWLPLYSTRPFLIYIYIYIFHEWDMLLIHQACLRHQAERTWLKHAGYFSCMFHASAGKGTKGFYLWPPAPSSSWQSQP